MYIIECDGKVIHGPGNSTVLVSNPILTTGIDSNGSLTFDLPPVNPLRSSVVPMKSVVRVLDDHEELWQGRVLDFESDFDNIAPITCEGFLGYLNDSYIRPDDEDDLESDWEIPDYLSSILEIHNRQVEEHKKIYLGEVTVTFPNIEDYDPEWTITDYQTTKSIIDSLKTKFEGHFQIRMNEDRILLDYLKEYTQEAVQEITFAKNLMDLKKSISGDKIKTAILPLGKDNLTIEDVNPTGKDFIVDDEAVSKYGFIIGTVSYSEIDDEDELYAKALEDFPKLSGIQTTLNITAVDLSLIDKNLNAFRIGDLVRITSPPHGLAEEIEVNQIKLDLTNPEKSEITLGDTDRTLTTSYSKVSSVPTSGKGTDGKDGTDGDPGPYFTPSIDSQGNLSWTNNGNLPNPPPVNISGIGICPYEVSDIFHTENAAHPGVRWPGTEWQQIIDRGIVGAGNKFAVGTENSINNADSMLVYHNHTSVAHGHEVSSRASPPGANYSVTNYGSRFLLASFGTPAAGSQTYDLTNNGTKNNVPANNMAGALNSVATINYAPSENESVVNRNYSPLRAAYIYRRTG